MFLTLARYAKKPKGKYIMVLMESLSSGHTKIAFRERLGEKKEMIAFDPYVEMLCLYKELKKVRTIRKSLSPYYLFNWHDPVIDEDGKIVERENIKKRKIPTLD